MPIFFPCPQCSRRIRVSSKHAGATGKCPKCKSGVKVPTLPEIAAQKDAGVSQSAEDALPTDSGEVFNTMVGNEPPTVEEERSKLEQEKLDLAWAKLEFERAKAAKQEPSGFDSQPITPVTEVPCPDCAELIKPAARVCRFCGCEVREARGPQRRGSSRRSSQRRRASGRVRAGGRRASSSSVNRRTPEPRPCSPSSFSASGSSTPGARSEA
ncbi:MAG: hypothetical protein R3F62_14180 [Planctomycetota bacterium]